MHMRDIILGTLHYQRFLWILMPISACLRMGKRVQENRIVWLAMVSTKVILNLSIIFNADSPWIRNCSNILWWDLQENRRAKGFKSRQISGLTNVFVCVALIYTFTSFFETFCSFNSFLDLTWLLAQFQVTIQMLEIYNEQVTPIPFFLILKIILFPLRFEIYSRKRIHLADSK